MTNPIRLPVTVPSDGLTWQFPERQYYSDIFNNEAITNVSEPALLPFVPDSPNGTAAVVCPGGGFHALSIDSEGFDVAAALNAVGITVFILKYRLVPSRTEDAIADMIKDITDRDAMAAATAAVIPLAFSDGRNALAWVRENAGEYGLDREKVGIIGFSAGGAVCANAALAYTPASRPAFAAPVYATTRSLPDLPVPADAPPLFALAASDDQLGLAPDSVDLYQRWIAAGKPAELHLYANGGHGFGMKKQGLPSDNWIHSLLTWIEAISH